MRPLRLVPGASLLVRNGFLTGTTDCTVGAVLFLPLWSLVFFCLASTVFTEGPLYGSSPLRTEKAYLACTGTTAFPRAELRWRYWSSCLDTPSTCVSRIYILLVVGVTRDGNSKSTGSREGSLLSPVSQRSLYATRMARVRTYTETGVVVDALPQSLEFCLDQQRPNARERAVM